jgi:hypothetical protein
MSEVEDTHTRIKAHKTVQGIVIVSNDGTTSRTTYSNQDKDK